MNSYFKKFIICFCIIGILFGTLRPRIAKANPIAIGAVEFVEGSLGGVVSGGAGYAGYDIIERYKKEASDFIIKKSLSTLTNTFFKFYSDSSGQKYVGIDGSGLDELQSMLEEMRHSSYEGIPVFTNKTTSNTTVSTKEPYMANGFYMVPYSFSFGKVYDSFSLSSGDTIDFYIYDDMPDSASNAYKYTQTGSFTANKSCTVKFSTFPDSHKTWFQYSYDDVKWDSVFGSNNLQYIWNGVGSTVYIGYKTTSNTVYVPSAQVITGNGIDGKASDSVGDGIVAVPISGQYDSTTGQKVWAPIDGANIGVKTGLTAIDASKVDAGSGTDTGSNTLTQEAVRDAVRDGIGDSTVGDLDIPSDVPRLDFTPLEVATKKFPFCVPFDFANLFGQLNAPSQCPVVSVPSTTVGSTVGMPVTIPEIDFDLSTLPNIDNILNITKFFEYIGFLAFLILKTRNLIRG